LVVGVAVVVGSPNLYTEIRMQLHCGFCSRRSRGD